MLAAAGLAGADGSLALPTRMAAVNTLLDACPRMASATASGPTEVVVIEPDLFFLLCRDDSDFADAVMHLLARRLRVALSALDRLTGGGRPDLKVIAGG